LVASGRSNTLGVGGLAMNFASLPALMIAILPGMPVDGSSLALTVPAANAPATVRIASPLRSRFMIPSRCRFVKRPSLTILAPRWVGLPCAITSASSCPPDVWVAVLHSRSSSVDDANAARSRASTEKLSIGRAPQNP